MNTHPGWCHPSMCVADEVGVTHSSTPRTVTLGEETLTLYLVQDHLFGSEPKRTEVHIDSQKPQHEWPADDVCNLSAALTGMYHQAHLLRAYVQRGDAA
jgi:hypothetical protein